MELLKEKKWFCISKLNFTGRVQRSQPAIIPKMPPHLCVRQGHWKFFDLFRLLCCIQWEIILTEMVSPKKFYCSSMNLPKIFDINPKLNLTSNLSTIWWRNSRQGILTKLWPRIATSHSSRTSPTCNPDKASSRISITTIISEIHQTEFLMNLSWISVDAKNSTIF